MGGIPLEKKSCYFFFSGYYTVATASELLKKYHIRNRIVKAPVQAKNSCQFAVLVFGEEVEMAKFIFERENVFVSGMVYSHK